MTPADVKRYYKTGYSFEKKTGMSHSNFSNWTKQGYIPECSQLKLQILTHGQLQADFNHEQGRGKKSDF